MQTRMRGAGLVQLGFLVAVLAGSPSFAAEDLDTRWTALRAEAACRLHPIAAAYRSARLHGTAMDVLETALVLAPDDEATLRGCRYRHTKDGWARPDRFRRPKNLRPTRPDLDARRDAWRTWFGAAAADLAFEASAERRDALHHEVLTLALPLAPDHALLRSANGEVQIPVGTERLWVLKETWSALQRRPALRRVAARALDAPPKPVPGELPPDLPTSDGIFGTVLEGPHVRVTGTVGEEELHAHYARCEAAWPVFEMAFGLEAPSWDLGTPDRSRLTVLAFATLETGNAWLALVPDLPPRRLEFSKPLAAATVPGLSTIVAKSNESGIRLEAAPRLVLDSMCITRFRITAANGWISEGLNHYLSWPIAGTRLVGTRSDDTSRYARTLLGPPSPLPSQLPADDWLAAGATMVTGEEKPDFHLMVGKDVNALTGSELLYGYCITAWLLEGRPGEAAGFLKALGAAQQVDLEPLLAEHLKLDVPALEARVARWLRETASLSRREG